MVMFMGNVTANAMGKLIFHLLKAIYCHGAEKNPRIKKLNLPPYIPKNFLYERFESPVFYCLFVFNKLC